MRRTLLLGGIGLAVIGLVAAGASAAGASRGARTLVLVQSAPEVAFVDLGDPGPSAGDVLVFRSDLFDTANAQVGDLNITCTQAIGPENICRGIFTITGRGQLSVDALPTWRSMIAPGVAAARQRATTSDGASPFQPSESTVHRSTYSYPVRATSTGIAASMSP